MFGDVSARKKLLVAAIVVVLILVGASFFGNKNKPQETKDITTGETDYVDPNSGDVVSNPEGKTPDKYGTVMDAPIFLGLGGLLDVGIAKDQTDDFKFAMYQYITSAKLKTKEVSINQQSIAVTPRDRESESTIEVVNFDIVLDRKDLYKVKMEYFDLDSIHLYIYDTAGKQLYDSGIVVNQEL
jgi:hypothetical protein